MSSSARKNSFDIVRFLAATFVILSHSYALVGLPEPQIGNIHLGGFSVWVFFILSGFLISFSWKQYPRFDVFMAKRSLRIFPGLIVAIILTMIVMGFLSTLTYRDYITHHETASYLNNILLLRPQYSLPGVFTNNIYPAAVNGSLWTLAYEFFMYFAVAMLGVFSLLKKRRIEYVWAILFLLNILSVCKPGALSFSIFYLDMRLIVQMGLMFFSGVLLQMYDKKIVYKNKYWISSLVLFFALATILPLYTALFGGLLLAYGIIGFSKKPYFSNFSKYGDFSYGLYIYAYPVQQTVWYFTKTTSPLKMFALAFTTSLILGITSWYLVESRFIKLKKHIKLEDYPLSKRHAEIATLVLPGKPPQ